MIEEKQDIFTKLKNNWQKVGLHKKVFYSIVAILIVLFIVSIGIASLNNAGIGLSSDGLSDNLPQYYQSKNIPSVPEKLNSDVDSNGSSINNGNSYGNYETRDYQVSIETNKLDVTCSNLENLKTGQGVVFLSSNKSKKSCRYNFKVANENAEPVITYLKNLKPDVFQENIQMIKKQLENNLNRKEILTKNLNSIEQILNEALIDYDNLQALAVSEKDSTALNNAIQSKIRLIDDLRGRREKAYQDIEVLNRTLADQEERLENTYFSVNVYESKYFDGEALSKSWKQAMKDFIYDGNGIVQNLTIGLFKVILFAIQGVVYILVVVVAFRILRRIIGRDSKKS